MKKTLSLPRDATEIRPFAPRTFVRRISGSKRFLRGAVALGLLCTAVGAQSQDGWISDRTALPGWLPGVTRIEGLRGADRAAVSAWFSEIERILRQVDELAHPAGFEIVPTRSATVSPETGNLVFAEYRLGAFTPTKAIAIEGGNIVEVFVNPGIRRIHIFDQRPAIKDAAGNEIVLEEKIGKPFPGATHVYGELEPMNRSWYMVLFTTRGESPFVPLTRTEYLESVIWDVEGKKAKENAGTTPYDRWVAEAPARRRNREQTIARVRANNPAEAAKLEKEFEQAERQNTELLKASLDPANSPAAPLRAALAALSPADRVAEAWVSQPWGWVFVPPGSANSFHALRANRAFYRFRRAPAEARGIEVRMNTGSAKSEQQAVYKAAQKLDWTALRRLLEPASKP